MKYETDNEFENFDFSETYVKDIEPGNGYFHIWLDNVKILPENSCNRDIRMMRTNNLMFVIHDMKMVSIIHEGVKIYDADGKPAGERPDEVIAEEKHMEVWPLFLEGCVYSLTKEKGETNMYTFIVDTTEGETYEIKMKGSGEKEKWDRFLNMESI